MNYTSRLFRKTETPPFYKKSHLKKEFLFSKYMYLKFLYLHFDVKKQIITFVQNYVEQQYS